MQGLGVTVAYTLAALFGLYMYTLQSWWGAPRVLVFGFLFVSLPAVALAFLVTPMLRREPTLKDFIPLLLVSTLIGTGGAALWFVTPLRVQAIERFGQELALAQAIDDPAEQVRISACAKYLKEGYSFNIVYGALSARPLLAERCLALPVEYKSRSDLERRLMGDWYYTLRGMGVSEAEDINACAMAQTISSFKGASQGESTLKLLSCSLNSSAPARRMCCTSALVQKGLNGKSLMALFMRYQDLTQAHQLPGILVATSFKEPQSLARLGDTIQRLELNSPILQPISLRLSCDAYLNGTHAKSITPYLDWLFPRHNGCLNEQERSRLDDIPRSDLCLEISEGVLGAEDTGAFICESKRVVLGRMKVAEERRKRLNREAMSALSDDIDAGHRQQRNGMLSMDGLLKTIDGQRQMGELGGSVTPVGEISDEARERLIESMTRQANSMMRSEAQLAKMKRDAMKTLEGLDDNPETKELMKLKDKKSLSRSDKQAIDQMEARAKEREKKATPEERKRFKLDESE